MKRISQVSSMAMMLALAACGGGGGNNGGGGGGGGDGGGQTPSGSLPQGATFSSSSGVASLSGESVTVNGTTYDNVNDDQTTGVRTYTASTSGTAAATDVEGDEVIASRVGAETLGATLNSGVYGAYVTGTDAELGSTSMGFYGGVNTTDAPTTGDASYSGGALGIETVIDGDGNETLTSYTGDMTATVDFETEANNTVGLDYDEFGTITSAGGSLSDTNMLSDGTVTVTGDAAANYTGGTNTLSAQLVGAAGAEMVGDVSLASAAATEGDSYKFSGGFGGVKGDDTTPPGGGGTSTGNAIPTGFQDQIPTGGTDGTARPDLDNLIVTYDSGAGANAVQTEIDLDRATAVDSDGLLVYTPGGVEYTGTANDTNVAFATRVGEESLGATLDFTSFGVWTAVVNITDGAGGSDPERRGGSFIDGTPPTGDIAALTGSATYTGGAIGMENVDGTYTQRTGTMSADVDFDTETLDTTLDFTGDGGPGFTFGGLALAGNGSFDTVDGTTTITDENGDALAAPYGGGITTGSEDNYVEGTLLGGDGSSTPDEIGGVFRVLGNVNQIVGAFGGSDTTP